MVQTSGFSIEAFESEVAMIAPQTKSLSHHEYEKIAKASSPEVIFR